MKNLTIFLFALAMLFLAPYAMAQPTLTAAGNPQVGDEIVMYRHSESNPVAFIAPGPAGEYITWDFSLIEGDDVQNVSIDSSPLFLDDIPNATFYYRVNTPSIFGGTSGRYRFYNSSNNGLSIMGSDYIGFLDGSTLVNIGLPRTSFDPAIDELIYPATYGDSYSDSYARETNSSFFGFINQENTFVTEIDGHGTLILPIGTFENVLRVKITEEQQSNLSDDLYISTYKWYKAGYNLPIMEVSLYETLDGNAVQRFYYAETPSHVSTPITFVKPTSHLNYTDLLSDFIVQLNPLGGFDKLEYYLEQTSMVKLTVYDLMGKKIFIVDLGAQSEGEHTHTLELGNIPKGVYLIEINADGIRQTQKVMIR